LLTYFAEPWVTEKDRRSNAVASQLYHSVKPTVKPVAYGELLVSWIIYQSFIGDMLYCHSIRTVVVLVIVVVVGVCNCSQMRTTKCTCVSFGVSIDLHHS